MMPSFSTIYRGGVGIDWFHSGWFYSIQRWGWNRLVPLYTEVGLEIDWFHSIQRWGWNRLVPLYTEVGLEGGPINIHRSMSEISRGL